MSQTLRDYLNYAQADGGGVTIFDAGIRTSEELSADIIQLALDLGWKGTHSGHPDEPTTEEVLELYHEEGTECWIDDLGQISITEALEWDSEVAIDWLNEELGNLFTEDEQDYYFGCDYGAFGLWPADLQ